VLCLQAADSIEVAKAAPFVEKLVADGYEVLYLTEAIDEAMVTNLAKFGDKELIDVSKEGINLGSEEDAKKVCVAECMLLVRAGGCCGLYVVLVGSQVREVAYGPMQSGVCQEHPGGCCLPHPESTCLHVD
jgi:hypothetical protein